MLSPKVLYSLLKFRKDRDWEQFHSTRNLAAALSVEASELLEHFIWASDADVKKICEEKAGEIKNEIADVAILLSYIASDLGIDIDAAVKEKIEVNETKYPVEKSRGNSRKYDEL